MNKKTLLTYPAIFTQENGQYWVEFIDLRGCYSDGETLAEAMENAKEAMGLYLEDLEEYPKCTTNIKDIQLLENQIISYVSVDLVEHKRKYENKSVKKTLSIPAWLNTIAERENINFSQVLQKSLMDILQVDNIQKQ